MLNIHSLYLKNIVHFKEAFVPITKNNGFVIISGHNKDSRSLNQNNGAGKSLLFSTFSNVMYAASPSSTLKNTKKDMLSKGSEIEVRFVDNNRNKIKVIQHPSKWVIFENGDDLQVHRMSEQQKKITEHFPLTQDEFYAYTYLSSIQGQRIHFQVDKPAERLKFVTSIFQLDSYDKLKHFFTQQLAKIKDEQIRFDVIESKLLNINTQLEKLDWSKEHASDHKRDKKRFESLKEKRSELNKELSNLQQKIFIGKSIQKLVEKRNELMDNLPDKPLASIKKMLKNKIKAIRDYESYERELRTYQKNTKRLSEQLESLETNLPDSDTSDIEEQLEQYQKTLKSLRSDISTAEAVKKQADRLHKDIAELVDDLNDLGFKRPKDVPKKDVNDELAIYETTLQLKKLVDNNEDSICPTCLQEVDLPTIRRNVKKAQAKVEELKAIKGAQSVIKDLRRLDTKYQELEVVDVEQLFQEEQELEDNIESLKDQLQIIVDYEKINNSLSNIEKPVKPSRVPKNMDIEEIEDVLELCYELETILSSIDKYIEEDSSNKKLLDPNILQSLLTEQEELEDDLKVVDKRFNVLMKKISSFDLKKGEYNILTKQKLELESDLEHIKPLLAKRDIYKGLEKAYSAKGLKVNKANEILKLIESNLNKYSGLIFAEPFSFNVYATEQGVFCDVDRKKGKNISDVRLLSGSESDSFKLLFLLSLLMLVPEDRRTNFVVLDEPDSHMDNVTRTLFAEQYLPFLRTIVPHVFLITPNDVDTYQDYEKWTVIKENGASVLEFN